LSVPRPQIAEAFEGLFDPQFRDYAYFGGRGGAKARIGGRERPGIAAPGKPQKHVLPPGCRGLRLQGFARGRNLGRR